MKLNTEKYKLTLMTEDICPDCIELKKKLTELKIPFINKSITANNGVVSNTDFDKNKSANRWEFIDLSKEFPTEIKYSPVMVIENLAGEQEVFSLEGENGFKNTDEAVNIITENYCI
jgi:glutaredoxin